VRRRDPHSSDDSAFGIAVALATVAALVALNIVMIILL
jgi:hypothetical protein